MGTQHEQLLTERLAVQRKYATRVEALALVFGFAAFFEFCYILMTRVG